MNQSEFGMKRNILIPVSDLLKQIDLTFCLT